MAISGRGDFPISATWWALSGRGRGREALTKQLTYANGAPTALAAAYGDYFFGSAGASIPLTLLFAGTSAASLSLTMGLLRSLTLTMAGVAGMALTLTVTPSAVTVMCGAAGSGGSIRTGSSILGWSG